MKGITEPIERSTVMGRKILDASSPQPGRRLSWLEGFIAALLAIRDATDYRLDSDVRHAVTDALDELSTKGGAA